MANMGYAQIATLRAAPPLSEPIMALKARAEAYSAEITRRIYAG